MTKTKDKLRYQLKSYEQLGYTEQELPHFVAGKEIMDYVMKQPGTMTVRGVNWSIENTRYDTANEMFDGASAIYLDVRWRKSRFIQDELIMPLEEHKKQIEEEIL